MKNETPFKIRIDKEKACRALLRGSTKKDAYKAGGYIPQGRDNSSRLANTFFQRKDVLEIMDAMKADILKECQGMTLEGFKKFLRDDIDSLSPRDKGNFYLKAMEKTGLDVSASLTPAQSTSKVDVKALAGMLLQLSAVNGAINDATTKLIDGAARDITDDTVKES